MKIFNIDEEMWFAGETQEEVWKYAKDNEYVDCPGDEIEIIELTPEDLADLKFFTGEDRIDSEENSITFQERLDYLIESGEKFPCVFATSDF